MNNQSSPGIAGLPGSRVRHADQLCDQFEAAWKAGQRPRLEDYVGTLAEPERLALLCELIPLEADYRRRAGEQPQPQDYQQRFPALDARWLAQALAPPADPTATAPGTAGAPEPAPPQGQQLRCPHCHNPIQ